MAEYKLRPWATKRILAGAKLIKAKDFQNEDKALHLLEGDVVSLKDPDNRFLGKLLVGRQNKGIGWLFTRYEDEFFEADFVKSCIEEAIQSRQSYFDQPNTNAFRLFNGEGDGLGGLTIDYYGGYLQLNWYAVGLYEYRDWVYEAIDQLLTDIEGIYETKRYKTAEGEESTRHVSGKVAPQPLLIKENDIKFAVYLGQGWMTGLFLDQREVRDFVRTQVDASSAVLNVFSYTGGFSVAAALGGSQRTVSVDVANRSLELTREQFEVNGIDFEGSGHEVRIMDVFNYVDYAKKNALSYDMVISDPPSFARSKKRMFRVEEDYASLAQDLFTLTNLNGWTILSTNHSGYELETFRKDMVAASTNIQGSFHLVQQFTLPEDFKVSKDRESQYLKVLVFYREK